MTSLWISVCVFPQAEALERFENRLGSEIGGKLITGYLCLSVLTTFQKQVQTDYD